MQRLLTYRSIGFDRSHFRWLCRWHRDEMKRATDNRELLEMNICDGDGWELLCPFLGVPVPDIDFPVVR